MVLSMGLDKGAAVTLSAQGPDEREAVEALSALVAGFKD